MHSTGPSSEPRGQALAASGLPHPIVSHGVVPGHRTLWAVLLLTLLGLCGAAAGIWLALQPDTRSLAPGAPSVYGTAEQAQLPPGAVPKIEPVRYLDVPQEKAREINAGIPFSTEAVPPASPLRIALPTADHARAVDCLAAAAWYEAGDDVEGQQAVIQVVLNRMRHPAFPKTACGVVFQGAERRTGCQFSFTCDGSLRRVPSASSWQRARGGGFAALGGLTYPPVGYATHYHTDWVVPYWSASVDKIAKVGTHLFFRWRGAIGRPPAFRGRHPGAEPLVARLAHLSPAHAGLAILPEEVAAAAAEAGAEEPAGAPGEKAEVRPSIEVPVQLLRGNGLRSFDAPRNRFVLSIEAERLNGMLALVALDLCQLQPQAACTVEGVDSASAAPVFHFYRDRSRGQETVQWDCSRLPRSNPRQCMPNG